jgi:membrane protein implicated in regulation of membrane protease activity
MGIGSGIFLFVVGAILAFAIHVSVAWLSIPLIGYILMAAGVVVFIISLILVLRKRSSVETVRQIDGTGERVTQHETKSDVDPML